MFSRPVILEQVRDAPMEYDLQKKRYAREPSILIPYCIPRKFTDETYYQFCQELLKTYNIFGFTVITWLKLDVRLKEVVNK